MGDATSGLAAPPEACHRLSPSVSGLTLNHHLPSHLHSAPSMQRLGLGRSSATRERTPSGQASNKSGFLEKAKAGQFAQRRQTGPPPSGQSVRDLLSR